MSEHPPPAARLWSCRPEPISAHKATAVRDHVPLSSPFGSRTSRHSSGRRRQRPSPLSGGFARSRPRIAQRQPTTTASSTTGAQSTQSTQSPQYPSLTRVPYSSYSVSSHSREYSISHPYCSIEPAHYPNFGNSGCPRSVLKR